MGTTMAAPPPPPDPTAGIGLAAAASVDKMAMYVGGQVMQTQMQTNMMKLMGMQQIIIAQDKLDAKLEIAHMNFEARMREAQMGHSERMTELAQNHVEKLAGDGLIELDSNQYNQGYPYSFGSA